VPQYSGGLFEPGDAQSADGISRALALLEARATPSPTAGAAHAALADPHQAAGAPGPQEHAGGRAGGLLGALVRVHRHPVRRPAGLRAEAGRQDDPVVFLAVGNEPALTLSQLEGMDDAVIKQLFEALKKKDKPDAGEDDEAPEDAEEPEEEELTEDADEAAPTSALRGRCRDRSRTRRAQTRPRAQRRPPRPSPGLAGKGRGAGRPGQEAARPQARRGRRRRRGLGQGRQATVRTLVAPGQFFLVRWGGTRKGAGTFYTRPQLAAPTVRRTLQPLAYDAVRTEVDARTGLDTVVEWVPKRPEVILALKVCDPAPWARARSWPALCAT
jgi:hypothetical protein